MRFLSTSMVAAAALLAVATAFAGQAGEGKADLKNPASLSEQAPATYKAAFDTSAGKFVIGDVPAGEYYIAVLIDADPGDLNEPSFLEQLIPSSIRITLGEGEKKAQDLRLGGG